MKSRKIPHISIIPFTEKNGSKNDSAVSYINNYLQQNQLASTEILDTESFDFQAQYSQKLVKPSREVKSLVKKIKSSSGILIVAPEFKGEYPSSLKNMIDFLYNEWNHKPVAISTVSDDNYHQSTVIKSLQFALWKVNSWTVPVSFSVPVNYEASRISDVNVQSAPSEVAKTSTNESEFHEVLNSYCNKYIQLCTKVQYSA